MCGRFVVADDGEIEEINKILSDINSKYSESGETVKTGEVFPTNNAAILSLENSKPSLFIMKWGFAKWDGKGVIINARSETVEEKKTFAKPFAEKRCVIPATGFFEWKRDGKCKDKFLFNVKNEQMLYMSGFYNDLSVSGESASKRFIILTRSANETISDIHDRMPVLLYKNELINWLSDSGFARHILQRESIPLVRQAA